ncbi:hypothetical protein K435DRAFT_851908 [Dendrothele bispora CBS 962.96]|uniref:Uncharacterized protein n=1 Tax=Dendrothele bispora (strain CBS 962.96) TaxID=1314807 RepID=A0A4S8MKR9_DENBC|nr:hypothetical protein K435DRAFT_851908 [Dendrothele bispora CBS 962.96]
MPPRKALSNGKPKPSGKSANTRSSRRTSTKGPDVEDVSHAAEDGNAAPPTAPASNSQRSNDEREISLKRKRGRPSSSPLPRKYNSVKRKCNSTSSYPSKVDDVDNSPKLVYPEQDDDYEAEQLNDQVDEGEKDSDEYEEEDDIEGEDQEVGSDDEEDEEGEEEGEYSGFQSEEGGNDGGIVAPTSPSRPSTGSEKIDAYGDLWHNFKYNEPDECEVITAKNKDKDLEKLGIYADRPPVKHSAMLNYNKSDIDAGNMIWRKVMEMYPKKGQLDIVYEGLKFKAWRGYSNPSNIHVLSLDWGSHNTSSGSRIEFLQAAEFKVLSTCHGPSRIFVSVGQVLNSSLVEPRQAGSRALSEKALRSITLTHLPTEHAYASSVFGSTLEENTFIGPVVYETLDLGGDGIHLVGGLQYTTRMAPWKGENVQKPPTFDELQKYENAYSVTSSISPTKSNAIQSAPNSPYKTKPLNTIDLQRATFHKTSMDVNEHIPIFDLAPKAGRCRFCLPEDLAEIQKWP